MARHKPLFFPIGTCRNFWTPSKITVVALGCSKSRGPSTTGNCSGFCNLPRGACPQTPLPCSHRNGRTKLAGSGPVELRICSYSTPVLYALLLSIIAHLYSSNQMSEVTYHQNCQREPCDMWLLTLSIPSGGDMSVVVSTMMSSRCSWQ